MAYRNVATFRDTQLNTYFAMDGDDQFSTEASRAAAAISLASARATALCARLAQRTYGLVQQVCPPDPSELHSKPPTSRDIFVTWGGQLSVVAQCHYFAAHDLTDPDTWCAPNLGRLKQLHALLISDDMCADPPAVAPSAQQHLIDGGLY